MEAAAFVLNAAIIALTVPLIADPPYECVSIDIREVMTTSETHIETEPSEPNKNSAEEDQSSIVGSAMRLLAGVLSLA